MVACGDRRAAGNVDVDRHDFVGAAPHAIEVVEDAACAAAGAIGDDDLRVRRRFVGAQGGHAHRARHRAGIEQDVGMARRGTTLMPKRSASKIGRDGGEDLDLAAVASAAVHPIDIDGTADVLQQLCPSSAAIWPGHRYALGLDREVVPVDREAFIAESPSARRRWRGPICSTSSLRLHSGQMSA